MLNKFGKCSSLKFKLWLKYKIILKVMATWRSRQTTFFIYTTANSKENLLYGINIDGEKAQARLKESGLLWHNQVAVDPGKRLYQS